MKRCVLLYVFLYFHFSGQYKGGRSSGTPYGDLFNPDLRGSGGVSSYGGGVIAVSVGSVSII